MSITPTKDDASTPPDPARTPPDQARAQRTGAVLFCAYGGQGVVPADAKPGDYYRVILLFEVTPPAGSPAEPLPLTSLTLEDAGGKPSVRMRAPFRVERAPRVPLTDAWQSAIGNHGPPFDDRYASGIIQRVVARHGDRDLLDFLTHIGVDELSYRRHHEYITVVVDHTRGRLVWSQPGKNAATLTAFFDELGAERCAKLEAVTIDMSAAYIKAVTESVPQAQLIFDRFHVQRLAQDAVDEVRRDEVRAATSDEERDQVKQTRWPTLRRSRSWPIAA